MNSNAFAFQGAYFAHDPSRIVEEKGTYWVFTTGNGVSSQFSKDGVTWERGPAVFASPPGWVAAAVPGKADLHYWAPDLVYVKGRYDLYYSVSLFGKRSSAIGLVTNETLDPADPRYHWVDRGPVIVTTNDHNPGNPNYDPALHNDTFNAIDPCPVVDEQGRLWLSFGSYWTGIKLAPLDSATGKRKPGDASLYSLAFYDRDLRRQHAIEASYLHRHGGYYYLFVNWDYCCEGVRSTYNIRVGRSRSITGPYRDEKGVDLRQSGGTLLLGTRGHEIGPGHAGVFSQGRADWLSYHYYDSDKNGAPFLGLRQLLWTPTGWPVAGPESGLPTPKPVSGTSSGAHR
jgi:arabinan endo-1,5-alpha-L-arabinosidase